MHNKKTENQMPSQTSWRGPATAAAILAISAALTPAIAHPGHGDLGFADGFAHPFGGLDHLAVMVAIGAASLARPAGGSLASLLALPAAFLIAAACGVAFGPAFIGPTIAEAGVVASLLIAAAVLVFGARLATPIALGLAGVAGLAHGAVHAFEGAGGGAEFGAGMILATAVLHALGLALGLGLHKAPQMLAQGARIAGAVGLVALFAAAAPALLAA